MLSSGHEGKAEQTLRDEERERELEEAQVRDLKILDEHAEQFNAEAEDTLS